jgi:hypothetical protein
MWIDFCCRLDFFEAHAFSTFSVFLFIFKEVLPSSPPGPPWPERLRRIFTSFIFHEFLSYTINPTSTSSTRA